MNYFEDISLLITHYKRSKSLENLLLAFEKLNCKFGEIVISDDGSPEEHLNYIKCILSKKFEFNLIESPNNMGLGNNINKGQGAVKKPYTLYIQEDFEPQSEFPEILACSLKYMNDDLGLDLVRFYAYYSYPYLHPFLKDNRFSEMYIPFWAFNYTKIYFYSDHPHLRRSNFLNKFGRYPEGIKGDKTEYAMCISVIQKKAKGLFYNRFDKLLVQRNSLIEPTTMHRAKWKESNNVIMKMIRNIYRQIKYNYDIKYKKSIY